MSTNIEKLLGLSKGAGHGDIVATRGGDILGYSKVVGVVSPSRGVVDMV